MVKNMDKKDILIIIFLCIIVALATYIVTVNTMPQQTANQTTNNTTNLTVNKTSELINSTDAKAQETTNNLQKQELPRQDNGDKSTFNNVENMNELDSNGRYVRGQYQGSTPAEAQEYERLNGDRR